MALPEEHGGGGIADFRFNMVIGEELMRADAMASGMCITLHNDVCLPISPICATVSRRTVDARLGVGGPDVGHCDDRARSRLGSGRDQDNGQPRWRRLRGQRVQDVHHERDQFRPGDHCGQDPTPTRGTVV